MSSPVWPKRPQRYPLLLILLCGLLCIAGCDKKSDQTSSTPAPPVTPEVRFERFIKDFRHRVEDDTNHPSSFVTEGSSGEWSMRVEDELIPPETDEGVYRAKVKVITKSSFTVITLPDETEDAKPEDDREPEEEYELGRPADLLGGEEEKAKSTGFPTASLQTFEPDAVESVYELVYVDGRWRLKTKPDPAKDKFLTEAFNISLRRQ